MNIDFSVVLHSLPQLLDGFLLTITMVVLSAILGSIIGAMACAGKLIRRGPFFWMSVSYIDLLRTLPEIVTIFWVYNCLPLLFNFKLGSFATGLVALSLFAGAYLAEVFRAGIQAVPRGQIEAAWSLGMPKWQIWLRIVIPQALRLMVPTFILFLTGHVKGSALLSTISIAELMYQATILSGQTFRYFEFYTVVGLGYFIIVFPLSMLAKVYERRRRMAER